MTAVRSFVREVRQAAGLQQQELAARVGVSRQSLGAIEAGTVPSTAVALEIARTLGCRIEDLFHLAADDASLSVTLARTPVPLAGSRVRLGMIHGSWIAHGLDGDDPSTATTPADGLIITSRPSPRRSPRRSPRPSPRRSPGRSTAQARGAAAVRPLRDLDALRENLLVAGCDPALGLLGGHLLDGARVRLHWIAAASAAALEALAGGRVHIAGLHLFDAETGEHNVPAVRARLGDRPVIVVNLAVWEAGFVVGAKRRLRRAADLAAPAVRVVLREEGSGARALLDRLLAKDRVPLARLRVAETVSSHFAVARSVAAGRADVGVATAAAAAAFGLEFIPLSEDRFDLVMLADTATGRSGQRLLETLGSGRFKRDIGALRGYGTGHTGHIVARLAA
jgi:putative molybdopterin biosynthesis protein